MPVRPRLAVHKFSSCDGCQLSLLNLGEALLELTGLVDIVHFAEAGPLADACPVDVALIEGSVSTQHDVARIKRIREQSRVLVAVGACATAGGLQALRNFADAEAWARAVYPHPEYLDMLSTATGIAEHVKVDFELWGCPANSKQVLSLLRDLLFGVRPVVEQQPVCMECKRAGYVCTLVARGGPCMGPVTRAGCGALCPSFNRSCYACYGPAEQVNLRSFGNCMQGLGLLTEDVMRRFRGINGAAPKFQVALTDLEAGGRAATGSPDGGCRGD